MAKIKKISFCRVGKQEGCICDRCGQYIRNIWTVQYTDGITARFGIDCFEQLNKSSGLSGFTLKEFNKTLKMIQKHHEMYENEISKTEETDERWHSIQSPSKWEDKDYWFGRPWKEYHEWMINEFFKARFEEDQKRIDRFRKVSFSR